MKLSPTLGLPNRYIPYITQPVLCLLSALTINLCIFLFIQALVSQAPPLVELAPAKPIKLFHSRPLPQPDNRPPKPQEAARPRPENEPPPPSPQQPAMPSTPPPIATHHRLRPTDIALPLSLQGPSISRPFQDESDRAAPLPIHRIEPIYPYHAIRMGIEGQVTVRFTITHDGQVRDPQIEAADPPGIFDQAVLNAIIKWKFPPPKADLASERVVRQKLRFKLEEH